MRRSLLLIAAVVGAVVLLVQLSRDADPATDAEDRGIERDVDTVPERELERPADTARVAARTEPAPVGRTQGTPPAPEPVPFPYALEIEIVERGTGEPLADVDVVLAPERTRQGTEVTAPELRRTTGADGAASFGALPTVGRWDVYAYPFDPCVDSRRLRYGSKVGTVAALPAPKEGAPRPTPHRFELRLGARVVLRSVVPPGSRPEDVLFELRAEPSPLSSQIGGLNVFARGRRTQEGYVEGRFHALQNSVRGKKWGVTAVTADGLFAVETLGDHAIDARTVVEIDQPFERRGKAAFVLTPPKDATPPTVDELRELGAAVEWGEPHASVLRGELPRSWLVGRRVARGDGVYELHALPLEPTRIGVVNPLHATIRAQRGDGRWVIDGTVTVTPAHGGVQPIPLPISLGD